MEREDNARLIQPRKQGDHVFNDLAGTLQEAFDTVRDLHHPQGLTGREFLILHVPLAQAMANQLIQDELWREGRTLSVDDGAETDLLREISRLGPPDPILRGIGHEALESTHLRNADRYGQAAANFRLHVLMWIRHALTKAAGGNAAGVERGTPFMAFQRMIDNAYDPAAAFVLVGREADRANLLDRAAVRTLLHGLGNTFQQQRGVMVPLPWEPYAGFLERRSHDPGEAPLARVIEIIHRLLSRMGEIKIQGQTLLNTMWGELASEPKGRMQRSEWEADFGYMLFLVSQKIDQIRSGRG